MYVMLSILGDKNTECTLFTPDHTFTARIKFFEIICDINQVHSTIISGISFLFLISLVSQLRINELFLNWELHCTDLFPPFNSVFLFGLAPYLK